MRRDIERPFAGALVAGRLLLRRGLVYRYIRRYDRVARRRYQVPIVQKAAEHSVAVWNCAGTKMEGIANACLPFFERFGTRTGIRAEHPRGGEHEGNNCAGKLRSGSHNSDLLIDGLFRFHRGFFPALCTEQVGQYDCLVNTEIAV